MKAGKQGEQERRILIVDDRYDNRYFLESLLTGHGYEVVSAKDGRDAFDKLKKGNIRVIVSDILMPEINGYELVQMVKSKPEFACIPFIFYTASYTDARHVEYGLSLGADDYLCKPSEPEELLRIIRKYL
jgi:CheY-like chemotaxis protein